MNARRWGAAALLAALLVTAYVLHGSRGRDAALAVLTGGAIGVILQRSNFCFTAAFRDFYQARKTRMLLGLLTALAVGSLGYAAVLEARIPDIRGIKYLDATGHINPAGLHLVIGGLLFGFGMVVAGGCTSANLFRLGEGSTTAPVMLVGLVIGFNLAFLSWNWIYLNLVATAPTIWLPVHVGYAGSLVIYALVFGTLALLILKRYPQEERRPAWLGGAAIGVLATFVFLRTTPLSVTGELSRLSRMAGDALGILPSRLHGLDVMKGCGAAQAGTGISDNGIFVLALIGGSFCAALAAGAFKVKRHPPRTYALALGGGVLMGFGAMISLGCTVGTLLSGIMVFSMSGWVFAAGLAGGAWLAVRITAPPKLCKEPS